MTLPVTALSRRRRLVAGASLTVLSGFAMSAATAGPAKVTDESFTSADHLILKDVVGTVQVRTGSSFSVKIEEPDGGGPLKLQQRGDEVVVMGPEGQVKELFRRGGALARVSRGWSSGDPKKKFAEVLKDYPAITVTVPKGADLTITQAAMIIDADIPLGAVKVNGLKAVYGEFGTSKTVYANIDGRGRLSFDDVAGKVTANIDGSGDMDFLEVGATTIKIDGSGDVTGKMVKGPLAIEIDGSGDVSFKTVKGNVDAEVDGSGDITTGDVEGGIRVMIDGSGDYRANTMSGPLELSIDGSGDVDIMGGTASSAAVAINGSGDVQFKGTATNPVVSVNGSGDVLIKDYEGDVRVSGDTKNIRIGNLRFEKKD